MAVLSNRMSSEVAELLACMVGFIKPRNLTQVTRVEASEPEAPWAHSSKTSVTFIGADPMPFLALAPGCGTIATLTPEAEDADEVRAAYPGAQVIQGGVADLIALSGNSAAEREGIGGHEGLIVLNPEQSNPAIHLPGNGRINYPCARWGAGGDATSIPSLQAMLSFAINRSAITLAVVPTSFMEQDLKSFLNRVPDLLNIGILRVDLAGVPALGLTQPTSLVAFNPHQLHVALKATPQAPAVTLAEARVQVQKAMADLFDSSCGWRGADFPQTLAHNATRSVSVLKAPAKASTRKAGSPQPDAPMVRLALAGRAHRILLLPVGATEDERLLSRLAVAEAALQVGFTSSIGFAPQSRLTWTCDLPRAAGHASDSLVEVQRMLETCGLRVSVDDQLIRHLRKADRRAHGENIPFPQWVQNQDGSGWTVNNGNNEHAPETQAGMAYLKARDAVFGRRCWSAQGGIKVKCWDGQAKAHVETEWPGFPVYPFAQMDASRVLARRSVIYSAKQGLGKTRFSILAFLSSGMKRGLWILKSRLVNEFKRELSRVGLQDEFHLIENPDDVKNLKRINVITYNRLWNHVGIPKTRTEFGPGGTYAWALAKYRLTCFFDEAHTMASPDSKQGIAARYLAQRAKRVILLTGTAIQSYPRNILGLLSAGWGDGTAANPYGASLRRPLLGGYKVVEPSKRHKIRFRGALVAGSTRFSDDFVDVIQYTPTTADEDGSLVTQGSRTREIPRIKDQGLWRSFLAPKLLRRVPGEPEVRASGFLPPEAKPQWVPVAPTPEHFAFYHQVLTSFAHVWEKRIKEERVLGKTSSSASACILPELDALRYASTVPVIPHRLAPTSPEMAYPTNKPTALMLEAAARICRWVEEGNRVLVGAEKPAALQWLSVILANADKWLDAEPVECIMALDSDISRRNKAIDHARDHSDVPVLMISVGMGKEGLNLPEFSKLITVDLGWTPGDLDQYRHRILRPGQTGDVEIVHLYHQGMIDSYMHQLTSAKADGIAEAVDSTTSTFDFSQWKDYRTFCLEMLANEGYRFAIDALAESLPVAKTA